MKFQKLIENYLKSKTIKTTYLITCNDVSIQIESFILETENYIIFNGSFGKEYLIMKDKIIGIRNIPLGSGTNFN